MNRLTKPSLKLMMTAFLSLFLMSQVAEAKRFGGGSSFGYSKSVAPKSYNTAPKAAPKAAPTSTAGAAAKPRSGMMGLLGGLAAGGLLAALFMGDGFEGIQIMDILLLALVAFVLFKVFTHFARRQQPQYGRESSYQSQPNYKETESAEPVYQARQTMPETPAYDPNASGSIIGSGLGQGVSDQAVHLSEVPAWFNADQFVEGAKGHFMTLQKAWDHADLAEVESYCSPELFAALQQEMASMQPGDNQTVVDTLYAELADMAIDGDYFIASIRFSGFIEENPSEGAHAFNEIWHIRRLANDEGTWQVAGIQQNQDAL